MPPPPAGFPSLETLRREVARVAVISLVGPGNTLLFVPALEAWRSLLPEARIDLLTPSAAVESLLAPHPALDGVERIAPRKFGPWWERLGTLRRLWALRRRRYDLSLTVFPSNRVYYHLIAGLLGARWRLTHEYPAACRAPLSWLHTLFVPAVPGRHDVAQNLALLEPWRGPLAPPERLSLVLLADDRERARAFLDAHPAAGPRVGFHIAGLPDMTYKRWPWAHYRALIDRLGEARNAQCLLLGGPDEAAELATFAASCARPPLVVADWPMRWAAALVARLDLVVSNDSGYMHVAAAAGTPVLGLFGPTDPARTAPWGPHARWLQSPEPFACRPCHQYPFPARQARPGCATLDCLHTLTPEMVLARVTAMLDDGRPPERGVEG